MVSFDPQTTQCFCPSAGPVYLSDLPCAGVVSHTYCSRKKVWLEREQYVHGWYKKIDDAVPKAVAAQLAYTQRKGVVQGKLLCIFPRHLLQKRWEPVIASYQSSYQGQPQQCEGARGLVGWLGSRIVTKKGKTSLNADHVCHHHVHHLSSLHQQGDSVTLSLYSHLICIKVATFTRCKDYKTLGFVNQVS